MVYALTEACCPSVIPTE